MMKFSNKLWPDILSYSLSNLGLIAFIVTLFWGLPDCPKAIAWIVLIIGCISLVLSFYIIKSKHVELKKEGENVKIFYIKEDFFKYIRAERNNSFSSVINIAGDMSWLDDEKEKIQQLIDGKTNLSMMFYYDSAVAETKKYIIEEYKKMGAIMIPYPLKRSTDDIKLMVVDIQSDKGSKMYGIERYKEFGANGFKVHIFNHDTYSIKIARELIRFLPLLKKKTIIGISGINNIGKTTLITEIEKLLLGKVVVIGDPWIDIERHNIPSGAKEKRSYERNLALSCLHKQLFDFWNAFFSIDEKQEIIIFDRTPVDNSVFLDYHTQNDFPNITPIRTTIKDFTKYLDLIILLSPNDKFLYNETSYLKPEDRRKIKKAISKRYLGHTNVIERIIEYNEENYGKNISEIASEIVNIINSKFIHPKYPF